ncbi:MAG: NTP transferase domain-containing protein [Acidimicrobiaceae bacterium]|nr:NTP transferase domain-containing protein [Acidimicrobiaceae bacterium]
MLTLLVMAAGLGRRFGGDKQLAAVGPGGESFVDYAVAAAARAGASRVVLVVRGEIEAALRRHTEARLRASQHGDLAFAYVRQDAHGPRRAKPWGTAHAVWAAQDEVPGAFLVCNADDYYAPAAMAPLAEAAAGLGDDEACLCGYQLSRTLPDKGAVSRGVCRVSGNRLVGIVEHHGVSRYGDGAIRSVEPPALLPDETVVSMNLWAFPQAAFGWIGESVEQFWADHRDDPDAECLLPEVVAQRMSAGQLSVRMVYTSQQWVGVTSADDLAAARAALSGGLQ